MPLFVASLVGLMGLVALAFLFHLAALFVVLLGLAVWRSHAVAGSMRPMVALALWPVTRLVVLPLARIAPSALFAVLAAAAAVLVAFLPAPFGWQVVAVPPSAWNAGTWWRDLAWQIPVMALLTVLAMRVLLALFMAPLAMLATNPDTAVGLQMAALRAVYPRPALAWLTRELPEAVRSPFAHVVRNPNLLFLPWAVAASLLVGGLLLADDAHVVASMRSHAMMIVLPNGAVLDGAYWAAADAVAESNVADPVRGLSALLGIMGAVIADDGGRWSSAWLELAGAGSLDRALAALSLAAIFFAVVGIWATRRVTGRVSPAERRHAMDVLREAANRLRDLQVPSA